MLPQSYQKILKIILPSLQQINIYADDIKAASGNPLGVAAGFSAGVDSYCVLADHHYQKDIAPGFRLTHLLYNNTGSHGEGGETLFKQRFQLLKPFVTEKIGLPFIAINSNLETFYQKIRYIESHTIRNASIALLLQNGLKNYMYASAYSYQDVFIGSNYISYSDLIMLPLLSTETLNTFSVGSEYSRVDKTIKVAQIKDSWSTLDVCINDHIVENCSTCGKCMRTLLTLEIAGAINHYRNTFDLEAYYKKRNNYIASRIISDKSTYSKEIRKFAKDKDFKFPLSSKLLWLRIKTGNKVRKALKKWFFRSNQSQGDHK